MITTTLRSKTALWIAAATVVVIGGGAAVALAATVSGTHTTAGSGQAIVVDTTGFPTGGKNPGIFTDRCNYSHEAADDPILAPNSPGASMHHDFFGNTGTSASSTASSLVGGKTTCSTSADASAYWVPVLYQQGKALTPKSSLIYWRQSSTLASAVKTVPAGLQIIAGNESATSPQSTNVVKWTCQSPGQRTGRSGNKDASATPHSCTGTAQLKLTIQFPSCWDGHTLSGAKQTNVVYPSSAGCPASHPVEIPQIVFHTVYPTSSASNLTVSMTPTMAGSANTEHADFVNGWTETTLSADVSACIATQTRCGGATGADATPKGPPTGKQRVGKKHQH